MCLFAMGTLLATWVVGKLHYIIILSMLILSLQNHMYRFLKIMLHIYITCYRVLGLPTDNWRKFVITHCSITAITFKSTRSKVNFIGSCMHLHEGNLHFD